MLMKDMSKKKILKTIKAKAMTITIDVQNASISTQTPDESLIKSWVDPVLAQFKKSSELTIRIVDEDEGAELNERWRK